MNDYDYMYAFMRLVNKIGAGEMNATVFVSKDIIQMLLKNLSKLAVDNNDIGLTDEQIKALDVGCTLTLDGVPVEIINGEKRCFLGINILDEIEVIINEKEKEN